MNEQTSMSFDEPVSMLATADILNIIAQWRDNGALRPLDAAFAKGLVEIAYDSKLEVQAITVLLAAVSSLYLSDGHVCLDLAKLFQKPNDFLRLPLTKFKQSQTPSLAQVLAEVDLSACLKLLKQCAAVTVHEDKIRSAYTPALDHKNVMQSKTIMHMRPFSLKGNRFYLSRFYDYEQTIAHGIYARLPLLDALADTTQHSAWVLKKALQVLFEHDDAIKAASQIRACALAARSRFSIITGGPGTGKTTTVVKLLAALQAIAGSSKPANQGNCDKVTQKLRIALAAPTGKASARLNLSISKSIGRLPLTGLPGDVSAADIPVDVKTIHQLLGSKHNSRLFRYHAQNPLPIDVLVIDEASMVDVSLMSSVILALRSDARLILLGDKDQLASVDAGAVLGQLAANAHQQNYSADTVQWLSNILDQQIQPSDFNSAANALAQNIAMLDHSFRFDDDSGIGKLAKMVNSASLDHELLAQFEGSELIDCVWLLDQTIAGETDVKHSTNGHVVNAAQNLERSSSFLSHVKDGSVNSFKNAGVGRVIDKQEIAPPQGYQQYFDMLSHGAQAFDQHTDPAQWDAFASEVLQSFDRFQVLCAMRKGPYGVEHLNDLIEYELVDNGVIKNNESFYQGRPVLVTRNDYNLGLTNGDVGIVINKWVQNAHGDYTSQPRVAFAGNKVGADIRWFSPSRLQAIETVYAMTVHKSQGSEFDHACLVLPDILNPVVSKELVYTAITRAKSWLSIISPNRHVFKQAINHPISRESGLSIDDNA